MSRLPRPLVRRLHHSNESASSPDAASERLRQRVLSSVRGEAKRGTRAGARAQRWSIVGGVASLAAIAAIAVVVLNQSAPAHWRASVHIEASTTRASLRRIGTSAELVVSGMPEPPIGEVYEVWLNHASGPPQPTDALFTVTSTGDGTAEIPGTLRGVREVMITSEPLGGSSSPTSAAVLRLRVGRGH
jgi:Anti-sigma-K factor rskA